ncbi:MAG TPA: protein kinase [Pyrinomonadaceae bacterium]|nr:protein kinase [Pyrinomonadaceae bacterium]
MPLSPNTSLGRYEITSLVGEGGMGEVYLAEDKRLRRRVALKLLLTDFAADQERLARFEREAHAASSLSHPNILTIYEIGSENGTHFIVTEFVEGESLRALTKRAPIEPAKVLEIGIQAASALAAAHAARIVHRDIKPENIMVRADGLVKVLDFGLAKFIEQPIPQPDAETQIIDLYKTEAGMVMGTVSYMSPEQARGQELDERTDVWSLGVVLYELLTARQPFTGDTMTDTVASVLRSEPEPPTRWVTELPAELDRIILKTLSKDREVRYRSAQDLLVELRQLQKRLEFEAELERSNLSNPPVSGGHFVTQKTGDIEEATTGKSRPSGVTTQTIRNSIAVLPFVNTSADAENEYFCDGLAEELLNALAKIEELKVAARTSAFSFKGKDVNVSQIARSLNVDTILEGSVRKSGTRLRILVRLVNAADGYQLWSERYDRQMQDIFDVQDEITLAVVDALKVQLLGEEKAVVLKRYTDNTEAYELYLKGRFHYNKHTPEGWVRAIGYYEQAIARERDYAPAYAAMTSALVFAWFFGVLPPRETITKCKAAARRALEIDDRLDESHCALGRIGFYYEWDWRKGERGYRRAVEINANSAQGHLGLGMILVSRERFDEAVAEGRRAVELDPLSLVTNLYMGWIYYFADRPENALRQVAKMIEIEPRFHGAYWLKGTVSLTQGRYEEAVAALEMAQRLGGNPIAKGYLGCAYARAGMREEAFAVLNELLAMREQQRSEAFTIARVYSALGDRDKLFEWLSKAIDERNGELVLFDVGSKVEKGNIWGENFRTDPRFPELLHRIQLPPDENTSVELTKSSSESATQIFESAEHAALPDTEAAREDTTPQAQDEKSGE